jgi:hypothetical protein
MKRYANSTAARFDRGRRHRRSGKLTEARNIERTSRRNSVRVIASSALRASSNNTASGSKASARATRCRCPPESCAGYFFAMGFQSGKCQQAAHGALPFLLGFALHLQAEGVSF